MKKNHIYLVFLACLFLVFAGTTESFAQNEPNLELSYDGPIKDQGEVAPISWNFSIKVVQLDNGAYGYQILLKDKIIIFQKSIPLNGETILMKTKEEAEKVAELMLQQANMGNFPPVFESDKLVKIINSSKN